MTIMAPRERWTDERIDELAKHMDTRFNNLERHMDARFDAVDKRFDDLIHMMQIGFGVIGAVLTLITAMLAGVIGLLVTQF
ncbi:MAG TPA: hypothetical protein VNC15_01110 [Solirubrobacterales bacterium]|nr:hypothetical protein [Solirubrobacterales bacterium]